MCSSKIRNGWIATVWMLFPLLCGAQNLKPDFTRLTSSHFVSFKVPGALFTSPAAINNALTVTGTYVAPNGDQPGFVRRYDGAITTFSVPGSGQTIPSAINDAGEIAGSYIISPGGGPQLCFVRSRGRCYHHLYPCHE